MNLFGVCNIGSKKPNKLMPRKLANLILTLTVTSLVGAIAVWGQSREPQTATELREAPGEFQFVRLAYTANRYASSGYGRYEPWRTDWPDAEQHFLKGISRLTRVSAAEQGEF